MHSLAAVAFPGSFLGGRGLDEAHHHERNLAQQPRLARLEGKCIDGSELCVPRAEQLSEVAQPGRCVAAEAYGHALAATDQERAQLQRALAERSDARPEYDAVIAHQHVFVVAMLFLCCRVGK